MNSITNYFKSIQEELKHVIWPTKRSIINHTILVILISVFVALFLFGLDELFAAILGIFL